MFKFLKEKAIKELKEIKPDKKYYDESQKIINYLKNNTDEKLKAEFKKWDEENKIEEKIDIYPFIERLSAVCMDRWKLATEKTQNGGTRRRILHDYEEWLGESDDLTHTFSLPWWGRQTDDAVRSASAFAEQQGRDVARMVANMYRTHRTRARGNRRNQPLQFENHYRVILGCGYIFIFVCWLTTIGVGGGGTGFSRLDDMLRGSGGFFWTLFAGLLIPLGMGGRRVNTFIRYMSYTEDEWEEYYDENGATPPPFGGRKKTRRKKRKRKRKKRTRRRKRKRKRSRKKRRR